MIKERVIRMVWCDPKAYSKGILMNFASFLLS